jgi:hypothetical protein
MKRILMATLPFVVAACYSVMAAAPVQEAQARFNDKINAWMEGRIVSLDAKANKFTVRGRKDEYASEYSKMMKEIQDKTANLSGAEKEQKTAEIHRSYADRLANARNKSSEKESDFTFSLTDKEPLGVWDERHHAQANADHSGMAHDTKEAVAIKTFADFKIGEHVIVGYDSGVITNTAYALIAKGDGNMEKGQELPTKTSADQNAPATPKASR